MSIWKIGSIKEQPSVRLYRWKIMKMEEGSFFAGDEGSGSGRVSTDIVEFDSEKNIGRTKSGRVYELVGEESPNLSMNADYVWNMYKDINRLTELDDGKQYENDEQALPEGNAGTVDQAE